MKQVSVIMGVYNEKKEWVEQTINSILKQSYKNIEIIVILDNPMNEELKAFLLGYRNKIRFYINEKNLGLVKTLNRAIDLAEGKYIARIDADDIADIDRVKKQVEFLENNLEYVLVGSAVTYIDEFGNRLEQDDNRENDYCKIKKKMLYRNEFVHPSLLIKKEILVKEGKYKEANFAEDYELLLRLISKGYKISNLNQKLIQYRLRANGISLSKRTQQITTTLYLQKIYKKSIKTGKYNFDLKEFRKVELEDLRKNERVNLLLLKVDSMKGIQKKVSIIYLMMTSKKYFKWFSNKIKVKFI